MFHGAENAFSLICSHCLFALRDRPVLYQKDPEYKVAVLEHADSSINLVCRPWVKASDYWDVYFDLQKRVKEAFDKENISIPFPQRDVHLYNHNA